MQDKIERFRNARVRSVDNRQGSITIIGTDMVDGSIKTVAFEVTDPETIKLAEKYEKDEDKSLIISVGAPGDLEIKEQRYFGNENISSQAVSDTGGYNDAKAAKEERSIVRELEQNEARQLSGADEEEKGQEEEA